MAIYPRDEANMLRSPRLMALCTMAPLIAMVACSRPVQQAPPTSQPQTLPTSQPQAVEAPYTFVHTPEWANVLGAIFIRQGENGDVLIKKVNLSVLSSIDERLPDYRVRQHASPPTGGVIYRYAKAQNSLSAVSHDEWSATETPVLKRWPDRGFAGKLRVQHVKAFSTLCLDKRPLKAAGQSVVEFNGSRDQRFAAVVSAAGLPKTNWFGGGPSAYVEGICFHEVFDTESGERIGNAIEMPWRADKDSIIGCWSPDSKYIIYFNGTGTNLCVIPAPKKDGE